MSEPEDHISFDLPVLRVRQPIGEFFIGVLDSKRLCEITDFDVRRILQEREFETYLGIQRPLNPKRVKEVEAYVSTIDACFPTAVVLSIDGVCAQYSEQQGKLTLSNYRDPADPARSILYRRIAKVIDGQHRIEGLKAFNGPIFDVNVCIFVDIDVAEEGYVFATVNLAQTKVSKSLVYDLFELARSHSPQKLCHNIAVALNQNSESPFFQRIKRLGVATEGRFDETLTQATFVEALLRYLSKDPVKDRDIYARGRTPARVDASESRVLIFRNMMVDKKDLQIADVLWNYFGAVRAKWPTAWNAGGLGLILNRTNGFRALMRLLRDAYLYLTKPGQVPSQAEFAKFFNRIAMEDAEFNTDNFKPGTSGEGALYRTLKEKAGI